MDRNILNKYKKVEDKLILSKIFDKINFCEKRNKIQTTDFLDLAQQQLVEKFLKLQKMENYIWFGGFEEAERKLIIFYPKKLEKLILENKINFNEFIKVLRIKLPNEIKGKYEHRNYLGALIKFGIKREKIGDIIVAEDGADILLDKDILKFVENNLRALTRFQKSTIEEIQIEDIRKMKLKKEEITIMLPSMRLDNVVSELAKCSRNNATEYIIKERVFVNFEVVTKQTKEIKIGDKITIRGKGRFEIKEFLGKTKKENIILKIEKM